jgi:hypothetical protein
MHNVKLRDVPVIPGLKITGCTSESRSNGEVRVTYTLDVNQKLLSLFKRTIHTAESYSGYSRWREESKSFVVLITCRDGERSVQAAELFTMTVVSSMQIALEARAKQPARSIPEVKIGASHRDTPPGYVQHRHRKH